MTKHYRLYSLLLAIPVIVGVAGCGCDPSITGGMKCSATDPLACTDSAGKLVCLVPGDDPCITAHPEGTWFCDTADYVADSSCSSIVCGDDSNSKCQPPPPLPPGVLSFYLDSTQTADEKLHYCGYSPGTTTDSAVYNDLVVGSFTPSSYVDGNRNIVPDWEILDGVPTGNSPTNLPTGWRGGISEPGDDAGRYSSIASIGNDLYVAYEYRPQFGGMAQLKVAYGTPAADGTYTWTLHTVDDTAGGALYTSIAIINGVPVVAYGVRQAAVVDTAAMTIQQPTGWLRIATAPSATPTTMAWDTTSWTKTDITSTTTTLGCVSFDGLCGSGKCVLDGTTGRGYCALPVDNANCVTATNTAGCGTGQCYHEDTFNRAACTSEKSSEDLPNYTGLFTNFVPSGTGAALVYYDRGFGRKQTQAGVSCDAAADCAAGNVCEGGDPTTAGTKEGSCVVHCDATAECGAGSSSICVGGVATTVAKEGYCIEPGGTLWGVDLSGAANTWAGASRFAIDGYGKKNAAYTLNYDAGIGATLVVDPANGQWHIAYMDGVFQRELYARVTTPTNAGNRGIQGPELIDDGFPNGPGDKHIVGDNASIGISGSNLRVVYSDASGLEARLAVRDITAGITGSTSLSGTTTGSVPLPPPASTWTRSTPTFPGSATSILEYGYSRGFWATQVVDASGQVWDAWLERSNNAQTGPTGPVGSYDDTGDTLIYRAP